MHCLPPNKKFFTISEMHFFYSTVQLKLSLRYVSKSKRYDLRVREGEIWDLSLAAGYAIKKL